MGFSTLPPSEQLTGLTIRKQLQDTGNPVEDAFRSVNRSIQRAYIDGTIDQDKKEYAHTINKSCRAMALTGVAEQVIHTIFTYTENPRIENEGDLTFIVLREP